MKDLMLGLYVKAQVFHDENGQDLIEYVLLGALLALAATAGMSNIALSISLAFANVGNKITSVST